MMKLSLLLLLLLPFTVCCQTDSTGHEMDEQLYFEEIIEMEDEPEYEEIFVMVEKMPSYPGGEAAMFAFLAENTIYPSEAKKAGIQGKVYAQFVVMKDGSIEDIEIMRGLGGGINEEVIRVIKAMPKWEPGIQRGKPVKVRFAMPFNFVFDDPEPIMD